ncbi:MAG: PorT family protein [Cytophagaceae bacterium]|jgi:hypothetical protein|nr:PorT family protein [Cytophagaceae bacterium]
MKKVLLSASLMFALSGFAQIQKGTISLGGSLGFTSSSSQSETTQSSSNPNYGPYSIPDTKERPRNINVGPEISYFISDKLALGISANYSSNTYKNSERYYDDNDDKYKAMDVVSKNNSIGVGLFGKYYVSLGEKAFVALKGSFDYSSGRGSSENVGGRGDAFNVFYYFVNDYSKSKSSSIGAAISPSILILPGKKIGIEFSLSRLLNFTTSNNQIDYKTPSGSIEVPYEDYRTTKYKNSGFGFGLSTLSPSISFQYYISK